MIRFICVLGLVSVALARPDVAFLNNGYQYNQQQQQQQPNSMQQELPTAQRSNNFYSTFQGQQAVHQATDIQPQLMMEPPRLNYNSPQAQMSQDSYQAAYQHSGIPHETGYANSAPRTQIHKHVYIHMPPKDFEEEDAVQPHVYHQSAPKQKHYKIVFIKSPEMPAARPAVVAPAPANEEKTLIYVLHKKPDTHQDIVIPAPAPTAPSKPEVFFIKYKSKKEGAPVYGVPPVQAGSDPRHAGISTSADYVPPTAAATSDELSPTEMTTMLPVVVDNSPMTYLPPTMASNEQTPTVSVPSSQYLPPSESAKTTSEAQMPVARYGPPNNFFFKH